MRGANPSKVKRSVGRPESAIAIVGALGPGITFTSIFSEIASLINRNPGSLMVGIPASVSTKTSRPSRKAIKSSWVRSVSLPSKKERMRAVKVAPMSDASLWKRRESSAAIISALSIAAFNRGLASSGFPSGVAARVSAICLSSHILYT